MQTKLNSTDLEPIKRMIEDKTDIDHFRKEISRLDQLIEQMRQNMVNVTDKTDTNGREVERLSQFVDMLSKSVNSLRTQHQQPVQQVQQSGVDEGMVREIIERLQNVENELMNFKNEFSRWVKEF